MNRLCQKLATAQTESLHGLVQWLLAIALALIVYYLFVAGSDEKQVRRDLID